MNPLTVVSLINGVLAGIPEAIAAYNQVKAMIEAGRDPTPDELTSLHGSMDMACAAILSHVMTQ
ncbi:hypothetical protein KGP36_08290 [Patescibacteria group bacterium]|nr:hypothetical protein [Patescibacteria group bacterium]